MVEDLIKYYEEEISDYGLVYKHMKGLHLSSNILMVVFIATLFGLFFGGLYVSLTGAVMYWPFILFFITLASVIIISLYYRARAKNIVETIHKIYLTENEGWKTQKFKEKQLSLLVGYLKRNNLYDKSKIEKLIQRISDQGKSRIPSFLAPGLILAFLLPLWNHLIPLIYSAVGLSKLPLNKLLNGAFYIVVVVLIVLFSLRIIYRYMFRFREEIFTEMFRAKSRTRDEIVSLLEDILLKL